jgi:hypothetical protein
MGMRLQACTLLFAAAAAFAAEPQIMIADMPLTIGAPESFARQRFCGAYKCTERPAFGGTAEVTDRETGTQIAWIKFRDAKVSSAYKLLFLTDEAEAVKLASALFVSLTRLQADGDIVPELFTESTDDIRRISVLFGAQKSLMLTVNYYDWNGKRAVKASVIEVLHPPR